MSIEDENRCLRRSLKLTGWVIGILVALFIGALIVIAIVD
jgi:hypothetical protein